MLEKILQLDRDLLLFLNGINSPAWDKIMWTVTANYIWLPLYVFILYYLIRNYGKHTVMIILFTALAVAVSDLVSVYAFKNVFLRLRPSQEPSLSGLLHLVNDYRGGLYGFVSSHAANTFMVAVFLSQVVRKKWFTLVMLCWCSVMSYSRIYLGVHYPGDLICGALLGSSLSFVIYRLYLVADKKSKGNQFLKSFSTCKR